MLARAPVALSFSLAALALTGLLSFAACSSSDTTGTTGTGGGNTGTPGGPVMGTPDAHCGTKSQATSAAACHPAPGTGGGSTGTSTGAGGTTSAGGQTSEYGETLPNAEGDDDDCKHHLAWTSTDIYRNTDVTFTVVASTKTDSKPLVAGELNVEAFLNDIHPAPNTDIPQKTVETSAGTYKIGPVRFDKAGKWTVRFHIHEDCSDLTEDSPHGHVAFFVDVP
jgi:hypothetical protein